MAKLRPIYIHVPGRASSKRQVVYMVKEQGKEKCQRQEESSISGWLMLFFFLLIGWEVGLFSTSLFLTPFSVIEKGPSTRKSTCHLSLLQGFLNINPMCVCCMREAFSKERYSINWKPVKSNKSTTFSPSSSQRPWKARIRFFPSPLLCAHRMAVNKNWHFSFTTPKWESVKKKKEQKNWKELSLFKWMTWITSRASWSSSYGSTTWNGNLTDSVVFTALLHWGSTNFTRFSGHTRQASVSKNKRHTQGAMM